MLAITLAWLMSAVLLGTGHTPVFTLQGGPNELFALAVRGAGDVNADGMPDALVYSVDAAGAGHARVQSGADGSLLYRFGPLFNTPPILSGMPIDGAGDVNGDGYDDLIIGDGLLERARVFSGLDGSVLHDFVQSGATTITAKPQFGGAVAGAGDVNADGFDDLLIGCNGLGPGLVQVRSGVDGALLFHLRSAGPGYSFGSAVDGAGDVNGDGHADLLVGSASEGNWVLHPGFPPFVPPYKVTDGAGLVRVYSGLDGKLLHRFAGDSAEEGLGFSVSGLGDIDGDGFGDVAAGTRALPDESGPGYARVYSGLDGSTLYSFLQGDSTHASWVSVDGVGDVDLDGRADVIVASTSSDPGHVGVQVFSGADGSSLFQHSPAQTGPRLEVAGTGDVNQDGVPDFLVGVPELYLGGGYAPWFVSP